MDNRAEIRDFLASRRARITPDQAGLPAYGGENRRVKGLRREEVALLAGVSIDYYVRMERGNLAGASDSVLNGVADALQLDDAEREHLFALARAAGPATRTSRPTPSTVRPVVQQVLDAITDSAGLGPQRPARHPGDEPAGTRPLLARARFGRRRCDEQAAGEHHPLPLPRSVRPRILRRLRPHGHGRRRDAATRGRTQPARQGPDHPRRRALHPAASCSASTGPSQNVKFHRSGRKRLRHPAVGELDLNFEAMQLPSEPELQLNIYTAEPGHPDADGLRLLATWAATAELAGELATY